MSILLLVKQLNLVLADGTEVGALKSHKAVNFFLKRANVRGLKSNHGGPHYVYVSSQTQASMKRILYTVEICMDEGIGNILAAQC